MRSSEHPEHVTPWNDVASSAAAWAVVVIIIVASVVASVVIGIVWSQPTIPAANAMLFRRTNKFDRSQNMRIISRRAAVHGKRTACVSGEVFDAELNMCAPSFRAPLALESTIMDTLHHTPCSSLYKYTCGKWIREHTNENRAFTYAFHKNEARIRTVIATTGPLRRFYDACKAGPIAREMQIEYRHVLETVLGDMRSHADLPTAFGRLARMGYTTPFALSIERHPTLNKTVPLFTADGFPDELDEGRIYQIMTATRAVTAYNIVDEQRKIQGILRIMRAQKDNNAEPMRAITDYFSYVDQRLPLDMVRFEALPQVWTFGNGVEQRGWPLYFHALDGNNLWFSHDQQVWVIGRAYMTWLLRSTTFDLYDWRAYLEFSILYHGAQFEPDLPSNVYFKQHDKRGPLGPGGRMFHRIGRRNVTTTNTTLDARCVRLTQTLLPGLTAQAFLSTYFPDRAAMRQSVTKVVTRILATLRVTVAATPWLSVEDRAVLTRKMDATLVRVAEPDDWRPEPFAELVSSDRYDHNLNLVRRYRVQRNLGLWHKDAPDAFDRSAMAYFSIPTTSVNAYYSGATNSITILGGILQPPFYSPLYNDVTLYAILGSIIGHEMSHMLDNHGLYWDETGALRTQGIISAAGMRAFYDATDCVVREYGDTPLGCESANAHYGNSTLSEDTADLTGIGLSYRTLFRTGAMTLSDRQQFFFVLSQAFCSSFDQEHLCEAVAEDEHAIPELRIDRTVRNMAEYQVAFTCREGDGMFKEPGDVCVVY
jgi:hypothetical protein